MTLSIAQAVRPIGRVRWRWQVWLQGPAEELDAVEEVVYTLHPSFPEPVQRRRDRETNFRLSASGWGEFRLTASVKKKDERTEELTHWLKLMPERTGKGASLSERGSSRVFLSFGAADAPMAQVIADSLGAHGVEVARADQAPEGMPPEVWSERAISAADATLVIWSNRLNRWMEREVTLTQEFRKPILPIVVYGPSGSSPEIPPGLQEHYLPVKWADSASGVTDVAARVLEVLATSSAVTA
jgi:hypothetical protein